LATLEWIPLFVLCWYLFLLQPTRWRAVGSAVALGLVAISDYYYLLYCLLAMVLMALWEAQKRRSVFFLFEPPYRTPFIFLCIGLAVTTLPLVVGVGLDIAADPVLGHSGDTYSLDVTALFVPGRNWRFGSLTRELWSPLGNNFAENNVSLGVVSFLVAGYALAKGRALKGFHVWLWAGLALFFAVLALGPALRVGGQVITPPILPYAVLEGLPGFSISGVPVRMVVMVSLFLAVLVAVGMMQLLKGPMLLKILAVVAFALIVLELLPRPLPSTPPMVPEYVVALKELPNEDAVLDWAGLDPENTWE
jgi:hypothetical protein